jgi:hypothetical protein
MKAVGFLILCVALVASCVVVRANDNANPDFISNLPAANTSAQAAALAALQQKLNELDQAETRPLPDTNAVTAPVEVPVNEASASATPVTESPAAETPSAVAPAITSAAVAPDSAAPAVVAPVPKVSSASAAAAVAGVPAVNSESDAMRTQAPAARTLPTSSSGQGRPSNELVTTTGTTYKNVEVQRVTADAIVISYTPAQGGWAMTKIDFRDLPPTIRQQYGKP